MFIISKKKPYTPLLITNQRRVQIFQTVVSQWRWVESYLKLQYGMVRRCWGVCVILTVSLQFRVWTPQEWRLGVLIIGKCPLNAALPTSSKKNSWNFSPEYPDEYNARLQWGAGIEKERKLKNATLLLFFHKFWNDTVAIPFYSCRLKWSRNMFKKSGRNPTALNNYTCEIIYLFYKKTSICFWNVPF